MRKLLAYVLIAGLSACAPLVRYTDALVGARDGRSWFTRFPATLGATSGFAVGIPISIVISPASWVLYRSQPQETREALSVFLFPSFVLWKVGALIGAPFDLVEWSAVRRWRDPPPLTDQERESIERAWDAKEYSEYPVTPIYPEPPPER